MSIHKRLPHWWTERRMVAQLSRGALFASRELDQAFDEAREKGMDREELESHTSEAWDNYFLAKDELEDALHDRLMLRASRYRVPIPTRTKDGLDWRKSRTDEWRLTDESALNLRRAVAEEIEIRQRPWLNWGPFIISGLGLVVAILSLLRGGGQ